MKVRRAPVVDQLTIDDETLVLLDDQLIRLSILPAELLDAAVDWVTVDELHTAMTARLGAPPSGVDAAAAVDMTIRELIGKGLLL